MPQSSYNHAGVFANLLPTWHNFFYMMIENQVNMAVKGASKGSLQGASLSLYIGSHLALKKKRYQINNQIFGSFRKSA